jgi:biopolymer transport protein ExbB
MDAQGRAQQAQLLRVGVNLYAYHQPANGVCAVAVSAPHEQAGFRWQEILPEHTQAQLKAAVTQSFSTAQVYALPIDVTGRMSLATGLSHKTIRDRLRSGGIVMIPLGLVALWLGVLILERWVVLLVESRHSLGFCDQVVKLCRRGDFDAAARVAGRRKGIVSRTLQVCLAHRSSDARVLDDAIQESLLHEFPKLERFLPSIKMLSSVAPMLGLLGTVTGIIATFDMITLVGSGKPRLMAGGISEALMTTATGLIIAIPGLLAHSLLSGKVDRIIADSERFAATLSNLIQQHRRSELKADPEAP